MNSRFGGQRVRPCPVLHRQQVVELAAETGGVAGDAEWDRVGARALGLGIGRTGSGSAWGPPSHHDTLARYSVPSGTLRHGLPRLASWRSRMRRGITCRDYPGGGKKGPEDNALRTLFRQAGLETGGPGPALSSRNPPAWAVITCQRRASSTSTDIACANPGYGVSTRSSRDSARHGRRRVCRRRSGGRFAKWPGPRACRCLFWHRSARSPRAGAPPPAGGRWADW